MLQAIEHLVEKVKAAVKEERDEVKKRALRDLAHAAAVVARLFALADKEAAEAARCNEFLRRCLPPTTQLTG